MSNRYKVMDGYTIDPEKRALWAAALRSGDYEQGYRVLTQKVKTGGTSTYQHCCLGVACELASAAGAVEREDLLGWDNVYYGAEIDGFREEVLLPVETSRWLDLRADGVPLGPDGDILLTYVDEDGYTRDTSLSHVNDQGTSFADIADIIDAIPDNPTD